MQSKIERVKTTLARGDWFRLTELASTHRVTSPFPGSLHPKIHHIHCPGDFRDVYAGIDLDSRPYDAISDVFLALPPVPAELHALRLHLACSGRLFQGNPFSFGQLRSLRGGRHECNAANKCRGDNAGDQSCGEMVHATLLCDTRPGAACAPLVSGEIGAGTANRCETRNSTR